MSSRISRNRPTRSPKTPSAEERRGQASANTRAFLEASVQRCSSSEHVDRTELYRVHKDWCYIQRINPVGPHRFYKSVWDLFGVSSSKSHGRRLLRGIRLVRPNSVFSLPKGGR